MSRRQTVARRLRTIPTFLAVFTVLTLAFPVLAVAAAVVDVVRGVARHRPWVAVRMLGFAWVYFAAEVVGLLLMFAAWVFSGFGANRKRLIEWTFRTQAWWAATLLRTVGTLFRMRFEVEGADVLAPGPIIVMMRHASIVDNLLPANFITIPHGIRLRYVLKRELLSDPALDVGGNRLPNYFVDRSAMRSRTEIEQVRTLADGLSSTEGVLIYPEGTRFTAEKRERALRRLENDEAVIARARRLRNLLPPRLGGPLALLDAGVDVVFCGHSGLGGFAQLGDIWAGGMVGRTVSVRFQRFPAASIPTGDDERAAWFYDRWQDIDDWIERTKEVAP